jgi:hypothetical protein
MSPAAPARTDERVEQIIIGGAVALALVVGLGLSALKTGALDGFLGRGPVSVAAPILQVVKAQAGGTVPRVLISGSVADEKVGAKLEAALKKALPGTEVKNVLRPDKRAKYKKRENIRISLAADAVNEAWPRPRFGDVKRLELLWKDDKLTVRGAVFSPAARVALEAALAKVAAKNRGAAQLPVVPRSKVPAAQLQNDLLVAMANRSITFVQPNPQAKSDALPVVEGVIDTANPENQALIAALAPLLTDLTGLEVILSAGAADRMVAMKQAEAVKAALVAAGADGNGLRPVPAPKNNALSLIVRERE